MMKLLIVTLLCLLSILSTSQTQLKMNKDAANEGQRADVQLNLVYQSILKEYKDDKVFIINLKIAQRLWIQFRDAELKARYPDREQGYYGSIQPMCWSSYLNELTEERTKRLKIWLVGINEGDGCTGSVKTNH